MTATEIVEAVLAALDIFIGWPVVIFVVVLLFRKQVEQLFGILGERLRRISVGGATAEFETASELFSPFLRETTRPTATNPEVTGKPVDEPSPDEAEMSEYNQQLDRLGNGG